MQFPNSPVHLMRLGVHAEQRFFENNKDKYDIVVFNANLAHYFASGTASLMIGKLNDKSFIIDPITHAYGHHPRYIKTEGTEDEPPRVKTSLAGLADEYGPPITTAIGQDRQVLPIDFPSIKEISQLAESALNFQANGLVNTLDPSDSKYIQGSVEEILRPSFMIAPYFFMKSSNAKEWLPINQQFVVVSREIIGEQHLFAEIVIDRGILDSIQELDEIAQSYLELEVCDGYLIWISDLSEHRSALSSLVGLKRLVTSLATSGKPVINLYGGYFSLLLSGTGMSGVCHGPGYGEDRDVIPVGGGMPTSKFYLTPVHHRLLYRDVQFMVSANAWSDADDFFQEVCSGPTCVRVLSGGLRDNFNRFGREIVRVNDTGRSYSFPTPETRELTTEHYLAAKAQEFRDVAERDLPSLTRQLQEATEKYEPYMPGAQLRYLDTWVEAIEEK